MKIGLNLQILLAASLVDGFNWIANALRTEINASKLDLMFAASLKYEWKMPNAVKI